VVCLVGLKKSYKATRFSVDMYDSGHTIYFKYIYFFLQIIWLLWIFGMDLQNDIIKVKTLSIAPIEMKNLLRAGVQP
jgi:hypothetical protein